MHALTSSLIQIPGLKHAFWGRSGGVSTGHFASLNASYAVGDTPTAVSENRRRMCAALGSDIDALVTLDQVHGSKVCHVTANDLPHMRISPPQADGWVTRERGILLGILTADCAPLLWVDPKAGVIGACHAGWRGTLEGILENTRDAMMDLGAQPTHMRVAIGPMIHQASYEVDTSLRTAVMKRCPFADPFFQRTNKTYRFDLPGLIQEKLRRLEVGAHTNLHLNTFEGVFFSYRRTHSQHPGEPCGRNLSVIQWA